MFCSIYRTSTLSDKDQQTPVHSQQVCGKAKNIYYGHNIESTNRTHK